MKPSTQLYYHLGAWAHHPSHVSFHLSGIIRALDESGCTGYLVALVWLAVWAAILL